MRVLVTGGAGFIGSHVVDACVAAGHEVVALDDLSGGKRENVNPTARLEVVDIRDAEAVDRVFSAFRPEAVSHQAAQVSVSVSTREPGRDAAVNVLGSIAVLEACVRHGTSRVVFASTGGAIYGEVEEPRRAAVGETERPLSPYACSKRAVELYLARYEHEHRLPYTVLRYANVYGPRQDPHGEAGVVAIFTGRLLAGEPCTIDGDGEQLKDYIYVGDIARANVLALTKGGGRTLNIGVGEGTSVNTIFRTLKDAVGIEAEPRFGPPRVGDVRAFWLDTTLAREALGWRAEVSFEEGIRRTVDSFRR